ncbi:MAG: NFYB/HAP3 family transcription factor subunit [Nanoarchaeota archaeon]|nr:NFYB/HAP3 family transcription factor subunit [Nanoarchaeota archaeon]
MTRSIIPHAAMEKLLKKAGAERVAEDAKSTLSEILEEIGLHLGQRAIKLAEHSGRKTIRNVDLKLAQREGQPTTP